MTQRGRLVARIVPAGDNSWDELILRGEVLAPAAPGDVLDVAPLETDFDATAALQRLRTDER